MNVALTLNDEFANEKDIKTTVKHKKDLGFKIAGIAHAMQFNCNAFIPSFNGTSLLFSKLCRMSTTQLKLLILHISRIVNEDIELFQGAAHHLISCWKAVYLETLFLNIDKPSLADYLSPLLSKDYFDSLAAEVLQLNIGSSASSAIVKDMNSLFPDTQSGLSLN